VIGMHLSLHHHHLRPGLTHHHHLLLLLHHLTMLLLLHHLTLLLLHNLTLLLLHHLALLLLMHYLALLLMYHLTMLLRHHLSWHLLVHVHLLWCWRSHWHPIYRACWSHELAIGSSHHHGLCSWALRPHPPTHDRLGRALSVRVLTGGHMTSRGHGCWRYVAAGSRRHGVNRGHLGHRGHWISTHRIGAKRVLRVWRLAWVWRLASIMMGCRTWRHTGLWRLTGMGRMAGWVHWTLARVWRRRLEWRGHTGWSLELSSMGPWRGNTSHVGRHRLRTTHSLLWRPHPDLHTLHRHAWLHLDDPSLLQYHTWSHTLLLLLELLHPKLLLLLLLLQGHSLLQHLWHGLSRYLLYHLLLARETPHDGRSDLGPAMIHRPLDMYHAWLDHPTLPPRLVLDRQNRHSRTHHGLTGTHGPDHARHQGTNALWSAYG
jgi:hypothetical protein